MTGFGKYLVRLAIGGKLPFSRQFLAWSSKRQLADMGPMSSMRYEFEIPDPSQPIPDDERGAVGPSGHLIPFVPNALSVEQVTGRQVDELLTYVGTYGMGGPGFFGLRLGEEWLVVAIWGAGEWMVADGILIQDPFFEDYGRPQPWITGDVDNLSPNLVGSKITSLELHQRSMRISFSNGMSFAIDEAAENRPIFEGNKKPREFLADDDLREAVFLAPTTEIWV
ncbi:hypothetical protein [Leisingera sp. ANG-Vp]|uniref:hypothetical protein n=1 Tax=Leisingera sp. ANG-Vp TaxID=1577896 RepID=UPI001269D955|nr:hypothetical protein [Leisingera sp. ANG-Vp]